MAKHLLAVAIAVLAAAPAGAAPPVRTMYVQATVQEESVRAALAKPAASKAVLKSVRRAIASYESVVRRYPASGYSDNALWQGARLALDAFERFGDAQDRATGLRLLRRLAAEYPTSKLSRQVPDLLAGLEQGQRARPNDPNGASPLAITTVAPAITSAASQTAVASGETVPQTTKIAVLTNIQRSVLPDVIRVTIALDTEMPFHDERLAGPSRIFIDFPTTRATAALGDQTLRFDGDGDLVRQVRIGRHPNATTRVVLDATGISNYSVYPIYNPYRLVIDLVRERPVVAPRASAFVANLAPPPSTVRLPSTGLGPGPSPALGPVKAEARASAPTPLVSRRIITSWARFLPSMTAAATADLIPSMPEPLVSRPARYEWARPLPRVAPQATAALNAARMLAPPLSGRPHRSDWGRRLPHVAPTAAAVIAEALAPPPEPAGAPITIPAPTPLATPIAPPTAPTAPTAPTPKVGVGYSMARQLGLGVSRIVIDPGHGGHDPGAKGKGSLTEASLVLDVSLRLKKLLDKIAGLDVILTRTTDDYVPLPERTAIANREGADLFLSIHANASANDQAHGVETYFLNFANNLSAAAVAARENAASGQTMGALPDFVKAIALNNKLDESHDFAALVQESMVERLRQSNKAVKNLGVKQAPFVVLIGASMPSVLAEISFLTHAQEAKLLKSSAYRQRIAEALFNAVRKYQGSLTRVQTVAVQ